MITGTTKSDTLYLALRDEIVRRTSGERFWSIRESVRGFAQCLK